MHHPGTEGSSDFYRAICGPVVADYDLPSYSQDREAIDRFFYAPADCFLFIEARHHSRDLDVPVGRTNGVFAITRL
jgi:hypothetical protein